MWKPWAQKQSEGAPDWNPTLSGLIRVLQHKRVTWKLIASAADVISADAELNLWIGDRKERRELGDEMLGLLERGDEQYRRCLVAIAEFEAGGSEGKLKEELLGIARMLRSEIK
jgi:hypothetical protein